MQPDDWYVSDEAYDREIDMDWEGGMNELASLFEAVDSGRYGD